MFGAGEEHKVVAKGWKMIPSYISSVEFLAMRYLVGNVRFPIQATQRLCEMNCEIHQTKSRSWLSLPNGVEEELNVLQGTTWLPIWFADPIVTAVLCAGMELDP